jgi:hypothetical protein
MAYLTHSITGGSPTATIQIFVICVVCTLLHLEELLSQGDLFSFRFLFFG